MPDWTYVSAALTVAVTITVALRATPFAMKNALRDSPVVADLSRWMPLGAVAVPAIYCLSSIDLSAPDHGLGPILGTMVTIGVHAWRRNAVLSILAGTTTCLLIVNAF
jgi:branched-subunit amino acid transport protein AzlD